MKDNCKKINSELTDEDIMVLKSFETVTDHLNIDAQLNKIKQEMIILLKNKYGKIVPVQNKHQLIECFVDSLNKLKY
jgi:hypothetical protein